MPTTPRGYPLLTADQKYALVEDYNKLATKADAEATVTEARAQETADAAKAYAQEAADEAERIARNALSKVEPVRALVDSANAKSDHAVTTAEAAYAYNQALVAPAADIVNAVVTDPASEAGALVASKMDKGSQHFNVRDYGAKGDGVTDDTAAVLATIQAALDEQPPYVLDQKHTIFIPRGVYLVDHKVLSTFDQNNTLGLHFQGEGMNSSILYMAGTMSTEKAFYDNGDQRVLAMPTFEDLCFRTDGVIPTSATDPTPKATFMKMTSTGHEKLARFNRCSWRGAWKRIFHTEGIANADTWHVQGSWITGVWEEVLYINNPQSVNHHWVANDIVTYGGIVTVGPNGGGSFHAWGGAWVFLQSHAGDTRKHFMVNLPTHATGTGLTEYNGEFVVRDVKTELRHRNAGLVQTPEDKTVMVSIDGANLASIAGLDESAPWQMVKVGHRGVVRLSGCLLPRTFAATVNGDETKRYTQSGGMLTITECYGPEYLSTRVTATGTGRAIGTRLSCYQSKTSLDRGAAVDFDLGWQTSAHGQPSPTRKIAVLRRTGEAWPGTSSGTEKTATLPAGAIIRRVVVHRAGLSSLTSTPYQIHVGSDDKTQTIASSNSAALNDPAGHTIDVEKFTTISGNVIRLWADTTVASTAASGPAAWIEYI